MADATAGGHRPAPAATGACRCSEGFPDGRFPSPSPLSGDEIFQDRRATLTSFAGIAMRLYTSIALSNSSLIRTRGTHGAVASTPAGRIHAAGHHPHRRLALSRRLPGRELQLRAHQALRADARARQVRRLLHGRPPGRAEHADRRAQAQPHGRPRSSRSRCCRRWRERPSISVWSPPARPRSMRPITSRAGLRRSTTSAAAAPAGTSSPPPIRTRR